MIVPSASFPTSSISNSNKSAKKHPNSPKKYANNDIFINKFIKNGSTDPRSKIINRTKSKIIHKKSEDKILTDNNSQLKLYLYSLFEDFQLTPLYGD